MSADLVVKNLAGGHAHRTLFDALDFTVAPGDVVGIGQSLIKITQPPPTPEAAGGA